MFCRVTSIIAGSCSSFSGSFVSAFLALVMLTRSVFLFS